jgi:hypothetical protein
MNSSSFQTLINVADNPWHFFTEFVFTQDPRRGVSRYPDYDYLREFLWVMHHERMLLVPKSRQMLVTWSVVAYALWLALFRRSGDYLFLSRNERCAAELLDRARFILDHLPPFMQPKRKTNSAEEIEFAKIGSRILSLPATPHGPRMYSPTAVFWDEMAFTPFDEQIWTALKPALDSGGQFIGVSSSGGPMNLFARMVSPTDDGRGRLRRPAGGCNPPLQSMFYIHRIHYSAHPDRGNDAWKRRAMVGLSLTKWEQEQEISFDAVEDLVYSEFDPVRHILQSAPQPNREYKLYRAIDFGYRHPYVLWLMQDPEGHLLAFDEWAGENRTTTELLRAVNAIDLSHGITEIDVEWTACDPAGGSVQDTGLSPVDILRTRGIKLKYRPSRVSAGVECVKQALRDARGRTTLFVSPRCPQLIADFRRYKWDARKEEPLKDGLCDHSMDALRYFFVNLETPSELLYAPRVASSGRL